MLRQPVYNMRRRGGEKGIVAAKTKEKMEGKVRQE